MHMFKREEIMAQVNEVPAWIQAGSVLLVMLYMTFQIAIQYTYGHVVATLAMVEDPETTAIIRTTATSGDEADATLPPYSDEEPDATLPAYSSDAKVVKEPLINIVQQEVLLIKQAPVTASVRTTILHLRQRAGRFSRFRGAGVVLLYGFLFHVFTSVWNSWASSPVGCVIGYVTGQVVLARISMLWTHIVISEPSEKRWYQRIATRDGFKKIWLPTLGAALVQIALPAVPIAVFFMLDTVGTIDGPLDQLTTVQLVGLAIKLITTIASALAYAIFCFIPVTVGLVRCQAALLSEEETPIISFDRSFGGKFVAESDGGSGRLTLKDAWKSFDWNARVRLIKIWVKMVVMQAALTAFFLGVAIVSFVAVGGLQYTGRPHDSDGVTIS